MDSSTIAKICYDFYQADNELPSEFVKKYINPGFIHKNMTTYSPALWFAILNDTKAWKHIADPTSVLIFLSSKIKPTEGSIFPNDLMLNIKYVPISSLLAVYSCVDNFRYEHPNITYLFHVEDLDVDTFREIMNSTNEFLTKEIFSVLCSTNKFINEIIDIIPHDYVNWSCILNNPFVHVKTIIKYISKFNNKQVIIKLKDNPKEASEYSIAWSRYLNSLCPSIMMSPQIEHCIAATKCSKIAAAKCSKPVRMEDEIKLSSQPKLEALMKEQEELKKRLCRYSN